MIIKEFKVLFSNLSSLNFLELIELRKNYKKLNYSITDIDLQIQKIISYPLYLCINDNFSQVNNV